VSEKGKQLLKLKGVETEEDTQDAIMPEQILQQFQKRKASKQDSKEWDSIEAISNPDGTLDRIVISKNGAVLYTLHIAWSANGGFKIMRL
jgi:hypothetical protein